MFYIVFLFSFTTSIVAQKTTITSTLNEYESEKLVNSLVFNLGSDLNKWISDTVPTYSDTFQGIDSLRRMTISMKKNTIIISQISSRGVIKNGPNTPQDVLNIIGVSLFAKDSIDSNFTIEIPCTHTSLIKYYNKVLKYNNHYKRLVIGVSGGLNANYRQLSATDYSNSNSINKLETRDTNERYYLHGAFNTSIGYGYFGHVISLNYCWSRFGYNFSNNGIVDPNTGVYSKNNTSKNQRGVVNSIGLLYEYSRFSSYNKCSPYAQLGFNFLFKSLANDFSLDNSNRNFFGTSLKLGIGLNIQCGYIFSIHINPVGMIMLNAKRASEITSRYFYLGGEVGIRLNIH